MRVGLVTEWGDCGSGYVSRAYKEALERSGHSVHVLARGRISTDGEYWGGEAVTVARRTSVLTGVSAAQLRRWIERNALETVIFNEQQHWEEVILARRCGVLVGGYVDYYREDTVELFRLYDFLLCNARRHHEVFAWHPQALFTPWGTSCDVFRPTPSTRSAIAFFHSAGWGGIRDRKGTDIAVEAFARVRGDAALVVHSQKALAEYPAHVRRRIADDARVSFVLGTVRPPGLYHLGDVYLYPARLDGIGLSVPEALAAGLPAIVPRSPPWSEFVDESTGTLVPVERQFARPDGYYWPQVEVSVADVAAAMQRYVDDRALLAAQASRCRERACARFDWTRNATVVTDALPRLRRLDVAGDLVARARIHDRIVNPSVWQQWVRSTNVVVGYLYRSGRRALLGGRR